MFKYSEDKSITLRQGLDYWILLVRSTSSCGLSETVDDDVSEIYLITFGLAFHYVIYRTIPYLIYWYCELIDVFYNGKSICSLRVVS